MGNLCIVISDESNFFAVSMVTERYGNGYEDGITTEK